jgi:hypothetical protein
MNFFTYYNTTQYRFTANAAPYDLTLTNITERVKIAERIGQYTSALYDYVIGDGQRPDNVAVDVYKNAKYTWLILLVNNINSLYDWPLTSEEFAQYLISRYGSVERAMATSTDHYYYFTRAGAYVTRAEYLALNIIDRGESLPSRYCYTVNGYRIDSETYDTLASTARGDTLTPYMYELDQNEKKRSIRVVNAGFLPAIDKEIRNLLR